MRIYILSSLLFALTSCASHTAKKYAANKCDIDIDTYYLKELSIEQLECMQKAGKNDPNFPSLEERIAKKKRELKLETEQKELQDQATPASVQSKVTLVSMTTTPILGGTVRVEGEATQKSIEGEMLRFCTENKAASYKIIETKLGRTKEKIPVVFSDLSFECVK